LLAIAYPLLELRDVEFILKHWDFNGGIFKLQDLVLI
jgi:hypothetical protein